VQQLNDGQIELPAARRAITAGLSALHSST
jgi:hypothetical protein